MQVDIRLYSQELDTGKAVDREEREEVRLDE